MNIGPKLLVVRTILQAVAAFCVAVPLASAQYGVPAETSAKYAGPVLGVLVVVTAAQNALEAWGGKRKEGRS